MAFCPGALRKEKKSFAWVLVFNSRTVEMPKQEGDGELILKGFLQIFLQFFSHLTSGLGVGECVSGRRVFKRSVATCSHSTPTQWVAGSVEENSHSTPTQWVPGSVEERVNY